MSSCCLICLAYTYVKQVVFLTVNHRGPLPLRELHSTGETECGETLGDLEPVYDLFTITTEITARGCDTDKRHLCKAGCFSYGESPRTPPLEGTSLHRRNKECGEALGDLEPVYDLFTITSEITARGCDTDKWHLCKAGFSRVNHRGPLPLRELHSTDETTVWRDPGGS